MSHLGDRLAAFVDGELAPSTREMVSAHLAVCFECRAAYDAECRTKAGLTLLGGPDPPADLMGSLLGLAAAGAGPAGPGDDARAGGPWARTRPGRPPLGRLSVNRPSLGRPPLGGRPSPGVSRGSATTRAPSPAPRRGTGHRTGTHLLAAGAAGVAAVTLAASFLGGVGAPEPTDDPTAPPSRPAPGAAFASVDPFDSFAPVDPVDPVDSFGSGASPGEYDGLGVRLAGLLPVSGSERRLPPGRAGYQSDPRFAHEATGFLTGLIPADAFAPTPR